MIGPAFKGMGGIVGPAFKGIGGVSGSAAKLSGSLVHAAKMTATVAKHPFNATELGFTSSGNNHHTYTTLPNVKHPPPTSKEILAEKLRMLPAELDGLGKKIPKAYAEPEVPQGLVTSGSGSLIPPGKTGVQKTTETKGSKGSEKPYFDMEKLGGIAASLAYTIWNYYGSEDADKTEVMVQIQEVKVELQETAKELRTNLEKLKEDHAKGLQEIKDQNEIIIQEADPEVAGQLREELEKAYAEQEVEFNNKYESAKENLETKLSVIDNLNHTLDIDPEHLELGRMLDTFAPLFVKQFMSHKFGLSLKALFAAAPTLQAASKATKTAELTLNLVKACISNGSNEITHYAINQKVTEAQLKEKMHEVIGETFKEHGIDMNDENHQKLNMNLTNFLLKVGSTAINEVLPVPVRNAINNSIPGGMGSKRTETGMVKHVGNALKEAKRVETPMNQQEAANFVEDSFSPLRKGVETLKDDMESFEKGNRDRLEHLAERTAGIIDKSLKAAQASRGSDLANRKPQIILPGNLDVPD